MDEKNNPYQTAIRVLSVLLAVSVFIIADFLFKSGGAKDNDDILDYDSGYSDGYRAGYDSAVEEFCYEGDAQWGGWYEGYEAAYEQYPRDVFAVTDTTREFFYDFFEHYCDEAPIADFFDAEYKSWKRDIPRGRALR